MRPCNRLAVCLIRPTVVIVTLACCGRQAASAEIGVLRPSDCLTKEMRSAGAEKASDALSISGARGETVSGQAVFHPETDARSATASISDLLHHGSTASIPAGAVKLQWVRYIDITRNTAGIPLDEWVARAPASIPDPYWEESAIPVKAGQAQPLWIEIRIPRDAPSGDYEGKLTVTVDGRQLSLPVSLHVWSFEVPAERHLSVVNWWSFPGHGFEKREGEYWDLLGRFAEFLVQHRQTDLSVGIGMITESGDATKGFTHDTGRLERYADVVFKAGIRQIHLHAVGRRTADILDPLSQVKPDEANLRRLGAWEKVIQRRGWQKRFAVSIVDEPFIWYEDSYADTVDLVHKTAPSIRVIEAVETEYLGKVDIYVPKLSHLNLWYPRFDEIRRQGAELWFYVCCHPVGRYPNRFLDQPLLKARVLFWICYLYNLDGYLHWGLNHFAGDPYTEEGISKGLPLGDRAVVYPGRNGLLGSLRFSAQRDGLQDFEYLWVLEDQLRKTKDRIGADAFWLDPRQRPLELCRRVIWSFHDYTRDPAVLLDTRRAIAEEIEALQAPPLLVVQTSPPEGTVIPAGPRHVNVRGLVPPGAKVTINGKPVPSVRPSGYFRHVCFMADDTPTITIAAEHEGKTTATARTFRLTD
ncbi:MAG: DUF6067 family protein [Phycisphaerae bacterium]|nr:DUF6067 family protein [Phycisphaerae bacterium]